MTKSNKKEECIFCKIVDGKIPSHTVYEDENVKAFLDVNPINDGHTLVIPKNHEDYIFDLKKETYSEVLLKAKVVAEMLKTKLKPKRVGVIVEGFAVPHVHVHLIPINKGNELNPTRAKSVSQEELKKIAEKIRK